MGFSMAAWRAQKYGVHPIGRLDWFIHSWQVLGWRRRAQPRSSVSCYRARYRRAARSRKEEVV